MPPSPETHAMPRESTCTSCAYDVLPSLRPVSIGCAHGTGCVGLRMSRPKIGRPPVQFRASAGLVAGPPVQVQRQPATQVVVWPGGRGVIDSGLNTDGTETSYTSTAPRGKAVVAGEVNPRGSRDTNNRCRFAST